MAPKVKTTILVLFVLIVSLVFTNGVGLRDLLFAEGDHPGDSSSTPPTDQDLMKLIPLDPGEQNSFIGMTACKKCHEQIVQFFEEKVKHAKAVATLEDEALLKKHNLKREDRCIGCHKVGGSDSRGVECEGCHGPAAIHGEVPARELKKRDYAIGRINKPDEAWCRKCHNKNSPEFKEFDYKKAYEKIKHKLPPKK